MTDFTILVCDEQEGISHPNAPIGTLCDDGDPTSAIGSPPCDGVSAVVNQNRAPLAAENGQQVALEVIGDDGHNRHRAQPIYVGAMSGFAHRCCCLGHGHRPAGRRHRSGDAAFPPESAILVARNLCWRQRGRRGARANPCWGDTRIHGALRDLGHEVTRSTVRRILADPRIDPVGR